MSDATSNLWGETQPHGRSRVAEGGPVGFDLLDEVGSGGMGVVFRARDLTLDREVAVKIFRGQFTPGSAMALRFLDEARITGQLQHPGIPPVYQVGNLPDGRPFLAMKLIRGKTLDELIKAGARIDPLGIFEAVAQAVGYAHAHGVVHRDLKPANVMVGAFGEVQVMDWGLAKVLVPGVAVASPPRADVDSGATIAASMIRVARDSDGSLTQAGSVIGTPAYMAPEQAAGEMAKMAPPADVFGLGAILCVLLTGKPPYEGPNVDSVRLAAIRGRTEEAFARLDASGADPGAVALCKRCLAFEPADRPATGDEVAAAAAALRRAADNRAAQAERDKLAAQVRAAEQTKQRRLIEWAAAAVVLVLAGGVAVSWWQARRATAEAVRADDARADADRRREEAEAAYALARESLIQVGSELPDVLRQAIYTRDARARASKILADALAKQLDPTAVRGLPGRAQMALHSQAGDVLAELGKRAEAEAHYRAALEVSTELLEAGGPEAALAKGNYAFTRTKLAVAERDAKRTTEAANHALTVLAEIEALQRELLANPPPDRTPAELRQSLAQTMLERTTTYRMLGQTDRALESCRAAIDLFHPRPDDGTPNRYTRGRKTALAGALAQLAAIETDRQNDGAAEPAMAEAAKLSAEVLADDPTNAVHRLAAARAARAYGDFLLAHNRLDEAVTAYAQDLAGLRKLVDTGEVLALRFELGDTYYRTATLALKRNDAHAAAVDYARCRALWQEVTDIRPTSRNRLAVALVQARLGEHEAAAAFPRQLLAGRRYTVGDGVQAVCVLALCGGAADGDSRRKYLEESLAGLTRLVREQNYRNLARLKTDPDLDPLRGEPAFQALVKELDAPPRGK